MSGLIHPTAIVDPKAQLGEGVDLNVSGTPLTGLTLSAAFTRTNYKFLRPTPTIGNTVNGQPRDVYNLHASYERKIGNDIRAGLCAWERLSALGIRRSSH